MSKKILLLIGIVIFLSYFIFSFKLYWTIVEHSGIAVAYVIDQLSPLLIIGIIGLLFVYKKIQKDKVLNVLKKHAFFLLVIICSVFFVHGLTLGFYFFGEEPTSILIESMNRPTLGAHILVEKLTGYHWGMYVLSYLFFGSHASLYNFLTLFVFSLVVIALYSFIYILLREKLPALFGTLFFITSPAYLDTFHWQANASGMSVALLTGLLFLIMLVFFQKTKKIIFYIFSLLFFVAMLKISFVRTLGFVVVPFYVFFFPGIYPKFSIKQAVLFFLPFFSIWFICFSIQFLVPMHFFEKLFILLTHPYAGVDETLHVRVRSHPLNTENYFFSIGTFLSYLFVPTQLAFSGFSIIKTQLQIATNGLFNPSLTAVTGSVLIILTTILSVFSFFKQKKIVSWVIFLGLLIMIANMFYIPLFISEYHSLETLDSVFIRNDAGNGPGSRYVFMSSVGVGIVIAAFSYWLLRERTKYKLFLLFGVGGIVVLQGYLSMQSHYTVVLEAKEKRLLAEQIFSSVPRDKEKKIIFSTNPATNSIEKQIGGEKWLNAFYPNNELVYVNDKKKFFNQINKEKYKKENVYAFYTNPETLAFADISGLVRAELIDKINTKPLVLQFDQKTFSSHIMQSTRTAYPFFLQRGVFILPDLNERFLQPKQLTFSLRKEYIPQEFPYLDILPSFQNFQVPLEVWQYTNNSPIIGNDDDLDTKLYAKTYNTQIADVPSLDKYAIVEIIKQREELRSQTHLTASSMIINDYRITQESLLDGNFIRNPLKDSDAYFLAKKTPTTFLMQFPYPIEVGRILLNVPADSNANLPTNLTIYASVDSNEAIGSLQSAIPTEWSPNKGKLYDISLQHVITDSLRIEVTSTTGNPIMVDEIIVDPVNALAFSPDKIYEIGKLMQRYINSREQLDILTSVSEWNSLTVLYACAEDTDWEKQKKNMKEMIPGIWKSALLPLSMESSESLSFPVDCQGSILRKIIFVSPPYPGKFTISNLILK